MRQYAVMSKTQKHGMFAVALTALLGVLCVPTATRATALVGATWNLSTSLTYANGGNLAPTVTGTVGLAPGKFGQGVSLGADSRLSYTLPASFNKTQGTVSFWYKAEASNVDFPVGINGEVFSLGSTSGNLAYITYAGGGSFLAASGDLSNYGLTYNTGTTWDAGDWLYFAFEWDPSIGIKLWVGQSGTLLNYWCSGPYTPAGDPTTINIGTTSAGLTTTGVWDDLYISDTLLYPLTANITVPTDAMTVPEPGLAMLCGLGGMILWFWRRGNRPSA